MRSKRFVIGTLVVLMVLTMALGIAWAIKTEEGDKLTGKHYNLNIIGVQKEKQDDAPGWYNEQRHTIMVDLDGLTKIYMTQGEGFKVLDGNGTDDDKEVRFQLDEGKYEVYAVALGKPDKEVTITPEATFEGQQNDEIFYLGSITLEHHKKPKWERVTGLFLVTVTVQVGEEPEKTYHNKWVFDIPELIDYWWNYDNHGCKLVQVRFYKVDEIPEEGSS